MKLESAGPDCGAALGPARSLKATLLLLALAKAWTLAMLNLMEMSSCLRMLCAWNVRVLVEEGQ